MPLIFTFTFCSEALREHIAHCAKPFVCVYLSGARYADRKTLHHAENGIISVIVKLLYVSLRIDRSVLKPAHYGQRKGAGVFLKALRRTVYYLFVFPCVKERDLSVE